MNKTKYPLVITKEYIFILDKEYENIDFNVNKYGKLGEYITKKVLAHLSLDTGKYLHYKNAAILPPFYEEEKIEESFRYFNESNGEYTIEDTFHFTRGYSRCNEKYKYSELDLIKAIELSKENNTKKVIEIINKSKEYKLPVAFIHTKTFDAGNGYERWEGEWIFD
jgi:hypothetical protein